MNDLNMDMDGIAVAFPEEMEETEAREYVRRGQALYGGRLKGIEITIPEDDPGDVELSYDVESVPFQRIRRITGYLVGTLERFNDAKRAEEHDRVKHGES